MNPYTFVPLPDEPPERRPPHGHHGGTADLLSARLHLRITAEAPLLVRGGGAEPELPTRPVPGGGRVPFIPGSGLHGAVRALHETLTGSCLRVVDTGWTPTYRHQADGKDVARLRLAVVEQPGGTAPDGRQLPPRIRMCAPAKPFVRDGPVAGTAAALRLPMEELARLHREHGLCSGDRLEVTFDGEGRAATARSDPHGPYVVFISAAGARDEKKRYHAAIRRLTDERRDVDAAVWSAFLALIDTSDDMRPERRAEDGDDNRWTDVVFAYRPTREPATEYVIGRRSLARPTVIAGQPLWVRLDARGEIDEVRLAQLWREHGRGPVGDRIGAFGPCTDPRWLCPACRLFGSADVSGPPGAEDPQRSYRGHVRFSDAIAAGPVSPQRVDLPPLGMPRPGAGQFYLHNGPDFVGNADEWPLRQWGSAADDEWLRRIRGRKFYWHTVPERGAVPARGQARLRQREMDRHTPAALFPAGTTFTATVTAVDVDAEQLGGLLAALDPTAVLDTTDARVHLGGGRPLGFGTCRIAVERADVWISAARYGVGDTADGDALLAGARAAFDAMRRRYGRTWSVLAHVLSTSTVAGETVWYPPGAGNPGQETYDAGFEFWKQSAGKLLRDRNDPRRLGHPLTVLPAADARDQSLPVRDRDAAREVLPNQKKLR